MDKYVVDDHGRFVDIHRVGEGIIIWVRDLYIYKLYWMNANFSIEFSWLGIPIFYKMKGIIFAADNMQMKSL